ncbi:MAG: hypothetical protein M1465_00860 [Candidatus Marsarchaeota archaeon]|jgi:hypothetical protein|nr:hypothetical protein [Candidatus Marsarchaeota archaeon]
MGEYKAGVISCERCGVATYGSSDRVSGANGRAYCKGCAQKLGLGRATKNNCAICGGVLGGGDVKMVLPSKSFGDGAIPLENRLACIKCYSSMASRARSKPNIARHKNASSSITKALHTRMMQQMVERAID